MTSHHKSEVDSYVSAVASIKSDFNERIQLLEKDTAVILREVKTELESMRCQMSDMMSAKAEASDLLNVSELLRQKAGIEQVQQMIDAVAMDQDWKRVDFETQTIRNVKASEDKMKGQIYNALDVVNGFEKSIAEIKNICWAESEEKHRKFTQIFEEDQVVMMRKLEDLRKEVDYYMSNEKITKREFDEFVEKNKLEMEPKVDLHEVQQALNTCQTDITNRCADLRNEV